MNIFQRAASWFGSAFSRKSDPTYAIQAQFFSPGAPIFSSKEFRTYISQGYRRCGTVYTCVNKIAGAAAGIRWKLYTDQSMSREITTHPLLDLWRQPAPRIGSGYFIEQCFGYWHLSGNCYVYANRPNPSEPPVELWPLRPDLVKIVAGDNDIGGYVYGYGTSRARDFDVEEILHLKFPAYDDEFYGLSPIEVAMQLVDQQNEGNSWNTALMQNAGKPASVFFSKGYLTLEQRTQVRQELLKRYSGKRNAGMPMVLEADMTWQSMAMSPYELDWLQSRELNTREIASIFDVAPELVGDSAGKTFANQKEAKQALYTENVLPKMDRFVGHVNAWLVPMYSDLKQMGAWFTYDKHDIEVLAELYTAAQQALSAQVNEMWMNGEIDLYSCQQMQGIKPDPNTKGLYRVGAILVRSADLQAYAQQALQKPAAPPAPVPEPMLNQPAPGQAPTPVPAGASTSKKPGTAGTEVPNDEDEDQDEQPNNKKPANPGGKTPAPAKEKRRLAAALRAEVKVLDLSTEEEKAAYAKGVEATRARWEEEIAGRLVSYFQDEQQAVGASIRASSTEAEAEEALSNALSAQRNALQQVIYNAWHDVGNSFGGTVARQLAEAAKSGARRQATKAAPDKSLFTTQTIAYLLNLAGFKVTQINATTLADLRAALADGVAAGESIPELAKRIDQLYLDEIIPNRSTTIARTEVVAASNWSSQQAASQSGLALNKVWLATEDSRTRPTHAEADGQSVPMDQPYTVGGEALMFPGDPDGSAQNVCNCRCTEFYQRVAAAQNDTSDEGDETDETGDEGKVIRLERRRTYRSVREFMEALA